MATGLAHPRGLREDKEKLDMDLAVRTLAQPCQ